jgi:glutamate synthase (NADPH/NADH) small chain
VAPFGQPEDQQGNEFMSNSQMTPGIVSGRLPSGALDENFSDLHPGLASHEAAVAADRCYFCYDAPCQTACPTAIDIPLFIRQIATGTPEAAARTIFNQNILGGMCARVCPTETLCEEVCVREVAEGKPVEIGRLQRYATDTLMESRVQPFVRAADTGKRVAVVGAGPAGLSCAHRLALHGHNVTLFEREGKAGGLNEFGIAAYKSTGGFAGREVDWLLEIGGITVEAGKSLGSDMTLAGLRSEYDAVFLSIGMGGVNALRADGEDKDNVLDAVSFIKELRQSEDLGALPIGRDVVVIGGGMTAVDAAVQSRLLGAQNVTMV